MATIPAILLVISLFAYDNKEFFDTAKAQYAEGFTWKQIECREATPGLPAITIKPPTGKEFVCNKLKK
jgi:hypothetical protein